MGISSNGNGISGQISAVQKQQAQLKAQQVAQARQLQENRIQLIKGAQEGLNLGLTKPTGPVVLPGQKKSGVFPFGQSRFLKNILGL